MNNKANEYELTREDQIKLKVAELCLDEWKSRDANYIKYFTMFYSCSIIVSLFPYIEFIKGALPFKQPMYAIVGSIMAVIVTNIVCIISKSQAMVYDRYFDILRSYKLLKPESDKKEPLIVKDKNPVHLAKYMPYIVCFLILTMNFFLCI